MKILANRFSVYTCFAYDGRVIAGNREMFTERPYSCFLFVWLFFFSTRLSDDTHPKREPHNKHNEPLSASCNHVCLIVCEHVCVFVCDVLHWKHAVNSPAYLAQTEACLINDGTVFHFVPMFNRCKMRTQIGVTLDVICMAKPLEAIRACSERTRCWPHGKVSR